LGPRGNENSRACSSRSAASPAFPRRPCRGWSRNLLV
jgi:hypothetical protein